MEKYVSTSLAAGNEAKIAFQRTNLHKNRLMKDMLSDLPPMAFLKVNCPLAMQGLECFPNIEGECP